MSLDTLSQLMNYKEQCEVIRIAKILYENNESKDKKKALIDIENQESIRNLTATWLADRLLSDLNRLYEVPVADATTFDLANLK